jgi:DNA repair exonuclease SbcCD ATPase subunit
METDCQDEEQSRTLTCWCLDEIFDSSLDFNGVDEFLKILNTLANENVFIISHKSDLSVDKFDHLIQFRKEQNFSKVTT